MRRLIRWIAALAVALAAVGIWATGLLSIRRDTGYFSPIFAPDGQSIFAVTRDAGATIAGFGYEFFTAPARVWLFRDRFTLVNIRLADGRVTVVETFPPSPLEGSRIQAYHGSIFGVPHAHLRRIDPDHLDYEIAVTRHDIPSARTYVVRRVWDAAARQYTTTAPWQETPTTLAGDEPQQLHGDLEAIAIPGDEMMPCGIAVLKRDGAPPWPLVQTGRCRRQYSGDRLTAVLGPLSRRRDIERAEMIRSTYAELTARGRQSGLSEMAAMLEAGRQMQRLGLFPKTTMLIAEREACVERPARVRISDEQFRVGLFQDIERAIARPGEEVDKSMGRYVAHRDYGTSEALNALLDDGRSEFFVEARGACWRMTISRP